MAHRADGTMKMGLVVRGWLRNRGKGRKKQRSVEALRLQTC